ncbi:hypothetical protein KVT40_007145 [Elsinoe batatas]|uniref:Initiation-specific alpha-1,6-mannosyltransferase n=1 Tax=Elsinoe batatas TaxID=2601811 RepID=A0A8K0PHA6_9PEZI|nr:hypothetical protein KVT40_007145 [Elsinoe batatas]
MLTFKRALLVAGALLTLFYLLHSTHNPDDSIRAVVKNSPKPTGSYEENKKLQVGNDHHEATHAVQKDTEKQNGPLVDKKQRPQVPLADIRARPLRQQLAYAFPYDLEGKFPGYIWQTWKYTPADRGFSKAYRAYEATWTEKHPGFVHEVITDNVAVHLISHLYSAIPEVIEAYNALPEPVLKADFFRYLILLARGGIYSDIDTSAIKSAIEWVPSEVPRESYGMVIGVEADPDRPDWAEWYSRRIQFCQWTIQSKPGHPILRDIVANITETTLEMKREGTIGKHLLKSIVEFTGPALWTDRIFEFFNNPDYFDMSTSKGNITWREFTGITKAKKVGDVVVLPITSFSPGVKQMGAGEDDDPMAFVKHQFEGSWKPESLRHIGENTKA